jgi:hypothetical protein
MLRISNKRNFPRTAIGLKKIWSKITNSLCKLDRFRELSLKFLLENSLAYVMTAKE